VHEVPTKQDDTTTAWAVHGFDDVEAELWRKAGITYPEDAAALACLALAPRQIPIPLGIAGTRVEVRVLRQDRIAPALPATPPMADKAAG